MRYRSIVCRTAGASLWALATLAWLSLPESLPRTFAQERDRERGDRERGGRGDRGSRRPDPKDFIPQMDANGNGTLEPNEISDRSRYFLESAAKDAGLDLARGVSVQKMIEAMEKRNAAREAAAGNTSSGGPPPGGLSPGTPGPSGRSSGGPRPGGFPGFGVPDPSPKPPGFNVPPSSPSTKSGAKYDRRVIEYVDKMFVDYDLNKDGVLDKSEIEKAPWQSDPKESDLNKDGKLDREELNQRIAKRFGLAPTSSAASPSGSPSSGAGSTGGSSDSQRVRAYAEGLLRQYDANKNGVLDKDEWSNVRAISKDTDANNDGSVTLDELTLKLGAYGKENGKSGGGATASSGGSTSTSSSGGPSSSRSSRGDAKTSGEKKSYRQRAATERLPKGLPDWFARNDEDSDGQVVMSEYSTLWSDSKATEFAKFDLDGDGVITPRECLRALEMETKKK